jgi:signal transduction histidine kinase/CheY-like chemotaxis protein/CHASE3 domain sensor protein
VKGGLVRQALAATGLLALVAAIVFGTLVLAVQDLRHAAAESRRAQQVEVAANELERLVIDLQTGQRGFLLTGRDDFLEPWRQAQARIPGVTASLRALVRDEQQGRVLGQIDTGVAAYLSQYSRPLVELARTDRPLASRRVASGEGKARIDALRRHFSTLAVRGAAISSARAADANAAAHRGVLLAVGGLTLSLVLIALYALFLSRSVVLPIRRLGSAARRLAAGDLSARVPGDARGEVGELATAFNSMASSLEESRDELEAQNAELELQTAELEDNHAELETANLDLAAQKDELAAAVEGLAREKTRVESLFGFAEQLASATDVEMVARLVLRELAEAAAADVGTVYALGDEDGSATLLAARGTSLSALPASLVPEGLPATALAERHAVVGAYGETGLRLRAFGEDVALRHEVVVPLLASGRPVAFVTLARVTDRAFEPDELLTLEHLGAQGAVAIANALSFGRAVQLATVNSAVLDATLDAILMIGVDGEIVMSNRAMAELGSSIQGDFGDGAAYERLLRVADVMVDPDRYRATIRRAADDPEFGGEDEFTIAANGRTYLQYTSPVHDADGAVIGRMFVARDVTSAREADQLKSELVATVSHELRTPLTGILGFSELLLATGSDDETVSRYLQTIHNEALRLSQLVDDFLDVQRIEAGGMTLVLEPFRLDELLEQQAAFFRGTSRTHELAVDVDDEPLVVLGERGRIAQVVANLLSNALKYSPAGGSVRVATRRQSGVVRVSISDDGLGIPAAQQSRIFGKFFRVDSSDTRQIGGTGLGLAISKELVEAHGGRIGFESVENAGSTFWFELPTAERGARVHSGRILVVDDDPVAAALFAAALEEDGHRVEVVATGEDALASATADAPALVCLDIGLAGDLDGWEVLERLKSGVQTSTVPVLICSAANGDGRAAALGASDVLAKPFSTEQLRAAVQRLTEPGHGAVLVVDDDPAMRGLLVGTLARDGFDVREAADGEEALTAIAERRPDAIILDLAMPGVDGFELLARLQADASTRTLPVLVVTAKRLNVSERRQLLRGATAVLEKSAYSVSELRRLVMRAVAP